jgi:hypothetical protein
MYTSHHGLLHESIPRIEAAHAPPREQPPQELAAQSSHTALGKRQLEGNTRSSKRTSPTRACSTVLPHSIWQTTAGGEHGAAPSEQPPQELAAQSSHTAFGKRQLEVNTRSSKRTAPTRACSTVLPHSIWQTTAGSEHAQLQGNSPTRASSTVLPHSIWQTTAGREQRHQQV